MLGARRLLRGTVNTYEDGCRSDAQHRTETLATRLRSFVASELMFGGADRDRTGDPLLAKQVLSQLSYSPIQKPFQVVSFEFQVKTTRNLKPETRNAVSDNGGPG